MAEDHTSSDNPYRSPRHGGDAPLGTIRLGHVGFALSVLGLVGAAIVAAGFGETANYVGACLAFLSLPGFVCSFASVLMTSRWLAFWGVVLGFLGLVFGSAIYAPMLLPLGA